LNADRCLAPSSPCPETVGNLGARHRVASRPSEQVLAINLDLRAATEPGTHSSHGYGFADGACQEAERIGEVAAALVE
jgi:hypothetical protein